MSGVTKHIYDNDIYSINIMWNKQLKQIEKILPYTYDERIIINLLKKYYPHEWKSVEYKKRYYDTKDRYLIRKKGKNRYNMRRAEVLIRRNPKFKQLTSYKYKKEYKNNFNSEEKNKYEKQLWIKREKKINNIDVKICKAKAKTQTVISVFLNEMIGLYERKTTSQKDKVYIIQELKKYYNPKVVNFFFKLNDTELNKQLREIAFKHLQSFNYEPRLRKQKYMKIHTKNKKRRNYLKKVYPNEKYTIPYNPEELEYRIMNGPEQKMKTFDFFISHSSKNSRLVQKLIDYENSKGKNVFCDWINDVDYLKRHLLCEATLKVIEWRLEQSNAIIFVKTEDSMESVWCNYELNYFSKLGKNIYYIDGNKILEDKFDLQEYDQENYIDPEYEEKIVLQSELIGKQNIS